MKASHVAVGVVGLALAGLWYAAGGSAPPAQAAEQLRVADPLTHENLTVYFVHGRDAIDASRVVSLQEALDRGWAVVHETGNVNSLVVENRSPGYELFVQSGDLIRGGKQDRMIATDMLVPPGSGQVPFPAHCVEQGRWTGRGNEAAGNFAKSDSFVAGKELKLANASLDQSGVWNEVRMNQQKLNDNLKAVVNAPESPTSFQLTLENRTVQEKVADFEKALLAAGDARPGVVGVVFVVNGKVSGAEVYGANGLFKKAWPKLLRSASVEALAEKPKARPPAAPSAREVEAFLVAAAKAEPAAGRTVAAADRLTISEPEPAFEGRSVATQNRTLQAAGGQQAAQVLFNEVNRGGGQASGRGSGQAPAQQNGTVNLIPAPDGINPAAPPQPGRAQVRFNVMNDNVATLGNSRPAPGTQGQPAGNRLNVNRVDNPAALMIESRDAARPSAVIHRSYIAK